MLVLIGSVMAPGSWGPALDGAYTGPCPGLSSEEQWLVQGLMPLLDSLLLGLNSLRPAFQGAVLAPGLPWHGGAWAGSAKAQLLCLPVAFLCLNPVSLPAMRGAGSWLVRKLAGAGPVPLGLCEFSAGAASLPLARPSLPSAWAASWPSPSWPVWSLFSLAAARCLWCTGKYGFRRVPWGYLNIGQEPVLIRGSSPAHAGIPL